MDPTFEHELALGAIPHFFVMGDTIKVFRFGHGAHSKKRNEEASEADALRTSRDEVSNFRLGHDRDEFIGFFSHIDPENGSLAHGGTDDDSAIPEGETEQDRDRPPQPAPQRKRAYGVAEISNLSTSITESPLLETTGTDGTYVPRQYRYLLGLSPISKINRKLQELIRGQTAKSIEGVGLSADTPYFAQQTGWSCGYCNIQMLMGSLRIMQVNRVPLKLFLALSASFACVVYT